MLRCAAVLALCSPTLSLRLPAAPPVSQLVVFTRRASLGALFAASSSAASAYEYKQRNSGASSSSPTKPQCEEGQRLTPDGFGGKKCVGEVKGVRERIGEAVESAISDAAPGDAATASAPSVPKAKAKVNAPPAAPAAPEPAARPLSMDELIANSIRQKSDLLGRELTDAEKADMAAKVKKLMGV